MKKCPFCAERIQDEAIKCRYCGEFLEDFQRLQAQRAAGQPAEGQGMSPAADPALPFYFRTTFLVIAFGCVGPLALPLLWGHPRLSRRQKGGWTAVILLLSWLLFKGLMISVASLREYYELIESMQF